jgi:hypothetical protein
MRAIRQPLVDRRNVRIDLSFCMPFCRAVNCTSLSARSMFGAPFCSARGRA